MKTVSYGLILAASGAGLLGAPLTDLQTPKQRATSVALANDLLAAKTNPAPTVEELARKNPFNPQIIVPEAQVDENALRNAALQGSRERFLAVAASLNPTGMVQIGGQPILLVGQKKFKVGDFIPIVFAGKTYELEVSMIDRTSFTLRSNGEDVTRPIKTPTNKP
jgi:hypothetical protein